MKVNGALCIAVCCFLVSMRVVAGDLSEMKYPNVVRPKFQFGTLGSDPGQFRSESGVAFGFDGDLYVCDTMNNRVQIVSAKGKPIRAFGSLGQNETEFNAPEAIAVSRTMIAVADTGNRRVQLFSLDGKYIKSMRGFGSMMKRPSGVALADDKVFVSDSVLNSVSAYSISGELLWTVGSYGKNLGEFNAPGRLTVDENGYVYVADSENNRIQKISPAGQAMMAWGDWGSFAGLMATPTDVSYGRGLLYVTDRINHRIQVFDRDGKFVYQWARHPHTAHEGKGRVHYPTGIAVSPISEWVAVTEPLEHRIQVFDRRKTGKVAQVDDSAWWQKATRFHYGRRVSAGNTTLAVTEADTNAVLLFDISDTTKDPALIRNIGGYGARLGEFTNPSGIAMDMDHGVMYVSDAMNHRVQVFNVGHLAPGTNNMAMKSFGKHGVDAGEFDQPSGLAFDDKTGELYVSDAENRRIEIFDRDLVLKREWKLPSPDTKVLSISLSKVDDKVFLSDMGRYKILVYNRDGKFLYEWGGPGRHDDQFSWQFDVLASKDGTVYVTDTESNSIKMFKSDGTFIKKWGSWGTQAGQFYKPKGITQAANGDIYVLDFGNHRGQVFAPDGTFKRMFGVGQDFTRPDSGYGSSSPSKKPTGKPSS